MLSSCLENTCPRATECLTSSCIKCGVMLQDDEREVVPSVIMALQRREVCSRDLLSVAQY